MHDFEILKVVWIVELYCINILLTLPWSSVASLFSMPRSYVWSSRSTNGRINFCLIKSHITLKIKWIKTDLKLNLKRKTVHIPHCKFFYKKKVIEATTSSCLYSRPVMSENVKKVVKTWTDKWVYLHVTCLPLVNVWADSLINLPQLHIVIMTCFTYYT